MISHHHPLRNRMLLGLRWLACCLASLQVISADLIFQKSDGSFRLVQLDGLQQTRSLDLVPNHANHDPRWRIFGTGVFNGAGTSDLLFQYHDGLVAVWFMDGVTRAGSTLFSPDKPDSPAWRCVGSGDFDGDKNADLIFEKASPSDEHQLMIWFARGPHQTTAKALNPPRSTKGMSLRATGDLDHDGYTDLVFQDQQGQRIEFWKMHAETRVNASQLLVPKAITSHVLRTAVDLSNQGSIDLVFQHGADLTAWTISKFAPNADPQPVELPGLKPDELLVAAGHLISFPNVPPLPAPPPHGPLQAQRLRKLSHQIRSGPSLAQELSNAMASRSVEVDSANSSGVPQGFRLMQPESVLVLPAHSESGSLIPSLPSGTLRLRYKPAWKRVHSIGGRGIGDGPTHQATLFSVGDRVKFPNSGWFEFSIDASGDGMSIRSQNHFGHAFNLNYLASAGSLHHVQFESNVWTEFTIVTTTNRIELWQERTLLASTNSTTPIPYPPTAVLAQGLSIGNSHSGGFPALGTIAELEFYNFPFGDSDQSEYSVTATATREPPAVQMQWKRNPFDRVSIRRRPTSQSPWNTVATNVAGSTWTDTNVLLGATYDYTVFNPSSPERSSGSIRVGVHASVPEYRGAVMLVVDETLESKIQNPLRDYERDLMGDGWRVIRIQAPRHNDDNWTANRDAIQRLRTQLQTEYRNSQGELNQVVLIGHVPIPYSGFAAEDGHMGPKDNHYGAWPTDLFYADIDGDWTDLDPYPLAYNTVFPETMNKVGDGKFDQNQVAKNANGDSAIELAVGRIDFARLEGFLGERISETALLNRYFEKNHRYRHAKLTFPPKLIAQGFSHPNENRTLLNNAVHNAHRNFGTDDSALVVGDLFRLNQRALWGYQAGFGYVNVMNNNQPNPWTSADVTRPGHAPPVAFYMLSGSWFGDWNLKGCLLKALLAPVDSGLASCWMRGYLWRWDPLAVGGTLGDALLATANDTDQHPMRFGAPRTLVILGDPTLRQNIVPPPTEARLLTPQTGTVIEWHWTGPLPDAYYLYSSPHVLGPFTNRIASLPPAATRHSIDHGVTADRFFALRAAKTVFTGAGCYTNLSQCALVRR